MPPSSPTRWISYRNARKCNMLSATPETSEIQLSICISTRNRASLIGATLGSIIEQLSEDCEIVVLDGASTDGTAGVVMDYQQRFSRLRYVRQETNNGLDR